MCVAFYEKKQYLNMPHWNPFATLVTVQNFFKPDFIQLYWYSWIVVTSVVVVFVNLKSIFFQLISFKYNIATLVIVAILMS